MSEQPLAKLISRLNVTFLDQMLPRKTRVIRIMPNTPVLVRSGTSVFSCGTATRPSDAALAKKLFSAVGLCEEVPEVLIDSCTGLSGSGPAYVSSPSNRLWCTSKNRTPVPGLLSDSFCPLFTYGRLSRT